MHRLTLYLALLAVLVLGAACAQPQAPAAAPKAAAPTTAPAAAPTTAPAAATSAPAAPKATDAPKAAAPTTAPAAATTAPAAAPKAVGKALTPVKFTLDFAIQGPQAPFLVALEKGYFRDEGLDVTIDRGLGSADAVNKIASGAYNMGYADINTLMEFNVKNPDKALQVIGMVLDQAPFSIITLKKNNISDSKALEGKKLGAPAGDAPRRLFPLFAKAVGIDASKVTWVTMDAPLREPTLIKGDVDAITGFYFTAFLNLLAAKVDQNDIVAFKYGDFGLDLYGNGIMASPTWLAQNEETAKAFMRGFVKGMQDTVKNPDEAIDILRKREPLLDRDVEKRRLMLALENNILTKDVKENGFGAVRQDKLAKAIDAVAQGFELPSKPDPAKLFTDKYLPPKDSRMPPK